MRDDFFVLMYATSGNERNETRFERYHDVKDVETMVQDWMKHYVALDCQPAGREAEIRAANGGELPEDVFLCPEVNEPKDLEKYNGFYNMGGLGFIFNVFLTPVYDTATAKRFRAEMDKEFHISSNFTEAGDRMMSALETFVNAFEDNSIDDTSAEAEIRNFIIQGGFSIFDAPYVPDMVVLSDDPEKGYESVSSGLYDF